MSYALARDTNNDSNRLFHWMGPKRVIWVHEKDLKMLPDPTQVEIREGESFYSQHHIHGCWSKGTYYMEGNEWCFHLKIRWEQVIVIRGNSYDY